MPARYSALPTAADAEQELEDAFGSDDEDDNETSRLTRGTTEHIELDSQQRTSIPGGYDFDRGWDEYPPPGSPPRPSAIALPNSIGNSNGMLPSAPIRPEPPRPSFFRRAVGAILPTHYTRVSNGTRYLGGGIENDGVFANVAAKPSVSRTVISADGDIHMVPEDNQKEAPPSYEEAAGDRVPAYWENTVHAPADSADTTLIDDLPSGSFAIFVLNMIVSFFFQFIGFLLTYLLHTSHAAKFGSRAGLGLTLIQFGFYSRNAQQRDDQDAVAANPAPSGGMHFGGFSEPSTTDAWARPPHFAESTAVLAGSDVEPVVGINAREWLAFLFMTIGWFLLLSSILGFYRVKRWEAAIYAAAHPRPPPTTEQIQHDQQLRNNLRSIFGIGDPEEDPERRTTEPDPIIPTTANIRLDANGRQIVIPNQMMLEEARLARDLRAAGLL